MTNKLYCQHCDSADVRFQCDPRRSRYIAQCYACGMREENVHGRHWRAFKKTHRDPAQGAGDGAGAGDEADPVSRARKRAAASLITSWPAFSVIVHNAESAVESCPPEVGEIIAWRVWRYVDGMLRSVIVAHVWPFDQPMTGDITAQLGVYSHKTQSQAHNHVDEIYYWALLESALPAFDGRKRSFKSVELIVGEVRIWGDVVEHERGYRSQFARVHSLKQGFEVSGEELQRLRKLYGVAS